MKKNTFLISTAIDYPSEPGHLGHALEKIQADVIARYKRSEGFNVHFSIGTDEHGLKIQRRAEKAGKTPQEFVNEMSSRFKDLWRVLNISNNDFIRTSEKRHEEVVQKIIKKMYENGDIYKGKYKGLYCVDCETYYLPKDLQENKCPIHHKPVEMIEEDTYFFKTSKYQKKLLEHIKKNDNFIIPESRKNEILSRLKEPLYDLSISRETVKWGIPLPFDKKLTLFVWVDALINYLTTINYPNKRFEEFWPTDVNVIGKDILWHHSVIWGTILLSLKLPLPKTIFVHGFISVDGQKMSKSLGNVINPLELAQKYGADAVRYFLLREIPSTEDGDFTNDKFKQRYNSDLASGVGNLVKRILTLAKEAKPKKQVLDSNFGEIVLKARERYKKSLDNFNFSEALKSVWELISFCDKYIEREKPWEKKENKEKFSQIINNLIVMLKEIADLLGPFLPETSERIKEQIEEGKKQDLLFPRI